MKILALLIFTLLFSPLQNLLAQGYSIEIVNQGSSGNGSASGGCTSFSIALESVIGVHCGESEALYYPGTGNIVVKKRDNSAKTLADARAAVDFLLSQPKVGSGVTDALKNNVANAIYWANADQYQNLLSETGNLGSGDRDAIINLIKKSQAQPSGTTAGYLQEEYTAKLSAVKNATGGAFDASSRKKEVEVFYNKFKSGSDRFKAALAKTPAKGFQDLNTEVDRLFSEIGSLNSFNPNYDALQAANRWLVDNYTHDGLILQLQSPAGSVSLSTNIFSNDKTEKYFAKEIRQQINGLALSSKINPEYVQGISLLLQADSAFAKGDQVESQRLIDRARNFTDYLNGSKYDLELSSEAIHLFDFHVGSDNFIGNETIQVANYLADIVTSKNGEYNKVGIDFAKHNLEIALSEGNFRSQLFHLEAASKVIDQLEGRQHGYFNGGFPVAEGHVSSNVPHRVVDELDEISNAYRAMDMHAPADHIDELQQTLKNFAAGNSLPYQNAALTDAAKEFGVDFKPDSFLGYSGIRLFNYAAASNNLLQNENLRQSMTLIGLSLMARKNSDLRGGITDLERGWSLINFSLGIAKGVYTSAEGTVEGLANLLVHPLDTTVTLGKAIYHYKETGQAVKKALVAKYEILKNCDKNAHACGEVVGEVTGEIAQALIPIGGLGSATKVAASARIAAIAEVKLGESIIKAGTKIGINSSEDLSRILNRIDSLNPCLLSEYRPQRSSKGKLLDNILRFFSLTSTAYASSKPCGMPVYTVEGIMDALTKVPGITLDRAETVLGSISRTGLKEAEHVEGILDALRKPKGQRPEPGAYLPEKYIEDHLSRFDEGAAYLVPKDILDNPAIGRDVLGYSDNTQFVMPKAEVDELIHKTGGNVEAIEAELGIPSKAWQFTSDGRPRELVRIDIPNPRELDLRMPSGNEKGANDLWLPAGYLPTGRREAVVNGIPIGKYVESPLK